MNRYSLFFAALILGTLPVHADFTAGLLARWTFNDASGERAALTDDVGGTVLTAGRHGADATLSLNPGGTVTLGAGMYLMTDAVNSLSERFATLTDGGTIYCRVKYLNAPDHAAMFSFGLQNAVTPANWEDAVFWLGNGRPGLSVCARLSKEVMMLQGSGYLKNKTDDFSDIAIVFNGKTKKVHLYVDGQWVTRNSPMEKLGPFQSFFLGRMKENAGRKMEVDEVRIYRTALSSEWIDEIEPQVKP